MARNALSMRHALALLLALIVVVAPLAAPAESRAAPEDEVVLYFFWGEGCPHCAAAKPMLAQLQARYPELEVRSFEVWGSKDNQRRFADMVAKFGIKRTGVPTFFLGARYWVGY